MDALTQTLMSSLASGGLSQIGQILGTDDQKAGSALASSATESPHLVLHEEGEAMTHELQELDIVELTEDTSIGLVEGARGTLVAIQGDTCTVEFVGPDGYTIGLFELPKSILEWVDPLMRYEAVARED